MIMFLSVFPLNFCLEMYFRALNKKSQNVLFTYQKRQFTSEAVSNDFPSLESQLIKSDIGIVLQGPICHSQEFTYQTIKHYLCLYPGIQIVLSTWKTENTKKIERLIEYFPNFHIVKSILPESPGPLNINLQIVSTMAGLRKIEELNLRFALKTRTDQCLFNPFALDKIRFEFDSNFNQNKTSRILFLSLNSFFFRIYGPSDMFQFGETSQIIKYWDAPLDSRISISSSESLESLREISKREWVEVYVCTHYLRKLGIDLDFTLNQNLKIFRDLFIIVDSSSLDLIWNKYSFNSDPGYVQPLPHKKFEWNSSIWRNLDKNFDSLSKLDAILDVI
jgi:hypothetical protein